MVVADRLTAGALTISGPGDRRLVRSEQRHGGPPYWWYAEVAKPQAGRHEVVFRGPSAHLCRQIDVDGEAPPRPKLGWAPVWEVVRAWDRDLENLFSAWLGKLFDDPLDVQPTWPALHEVLRDPQRNFLHEHYGLGVDDPAKGPLIEPDCADLPYTLRAYFAYKLGLPFGYSRCTRGTSRGPPICNRFFSSLTANKGQNADPVRRLGNFLRVTLADRVHSGGPRTAPEAEESDFYPVQLNAESLRPGVIFADPYGHILMVVQRIPQTETSGGVLLAVDGQPDGTVSRRRFWRGNFLFSDDVKLGGPGFKHFRPVVVDAPGQARQLSNEEVKRHPAYGDFGLNQYQGGVDGFYELVEDILSPSPRDPRQVFSEIIQALDEQVERRVLSVQNGVDYRAKHGLITMPERDEIFQTQGPWEDFSTPSRDMRLLIAIDVVRFFPATVERRSKRYAMPQGKTAAEVRAELEALLATEAGKRKFHYIRSDGSKQELTLADVLARVKGFELAYNPNDCPEKRWAAPEGSRELSTCGRHAPLAQRQRMAEYRSWFADRRRPVH